MLGRVIVAVAVFLGTSFAATAQGDRRDIVDKIHEQITRNYTKYIGEQRIKALSGCINWEDSTLDNINVRHLLYFYAVEGAFLPSTLMRSAIQRCNELRKKHRSTCKCGPIDKNGKSALKIPDSFFEKARAYTPAKPVVAGSSGRFDGKWEGVMRCGTCDNCIGPLKKPISISVKNSKFDIIPDATYLGIGIIDDEGNLKIDWSHNSPDVNMKSRRNFRFSGKYEGKSLVLSGERGPRSCDITLSRVNSPED